MTEIWIERLPFIFLAERDRDIEDENHTMLKHDVIVGRRTTARARGMTGAHVQLTRAFLAMPRAVRRRIVEEVAPVVETHACEGCSRALAKAVEP